VVVENTADMPWEPYSSKFTEREKAARASHWRRKLSQCTPLNVP
jgi:hypothetical protein